jgi:hypothetical protein
VDGRFDVTGSFEAHASTLDRLPENAAGQFQLTSKGGVFRGLPVNVGNLVENSGKLASWLAAASDVITSPFMGRKDYDEITSRSQAANELARLLSSISYDQLSMTAVRDAGANLAIRDFSLISPVLRMAGSGSGRSFAKGPAIAENVNLELRLRARGRPAELMKYLGILEPRVDDLGYAGCTIPARVEGPLNRLDSPQLSNRLVALAVEKTGLTEKAVDWINRLRGKSTN